MLDKLAQRIAEGAQEKLSAYLKFNEAREKLLSQFLNRNIEFVDLALDIPKLRQLRAPEAEIFFGMAHDVDSGNTYIFVSPRRQFVRSKVEETAKNLGGHTVKKTFYIMSAGDIASWEKSKLTGLRKLVRKWNQSTGVRWKQIFKNVLDLEVTAQKKFSGESLVYRELTERWERYISKKAKRVSRDRLSVHVHHASVVREKDPDSKLWVCSIEYTAHAEEGEEDGLTVAIFGDRGQLKAWLSWYLDTLKEIHNAAIDSVYIFNTTRKDVLNWTEKRGKLPGLYLLTRTYLKETGRNWERVFKVERDETEDAEEEDEEGGLAASLNPTAAYKPKHLEKLEDIFIVEDNEYHEYYPVISVHRDSENIARANFNSAEQYLKEVVNNIPDEEWDRTGMEPGKALVIGRARHWAVGWIDTIYVHKDAPDELLKAADEIVASLQDYPVLDEGALSELEFEELSEYFQNSTVGDIIRIWSSMFEDKEYERTGSEAPLDCVFEFEEFCSKWLEDNDAFRELTDMDPDAYSEGYFRQEVVEKYAENTFDQVYEEFFKKSSK